MICIQPIDRRTNRPLASWLSPAAVLVACLAGTATAQAATRYVDGATGANTGNCSSEASPCATINYAIGQSFPGDTVQIAAGTYTETGSLTINHALQLQGAGEDDTVVQAHAVPGMATHRVVSICPIALQCPGGSFDVAIADLTLRHGVADMGSGDGGAGGGVFAQLAGLSLSRVTLTENKARAGGGLFVRNSAVPMLTQVTFASNHAASGGGMYSGEGSSPQLTDVAFEGNTAIPDGTGGGFGGGMYNNGSAPSLRDVSFTANVAEAGGGGMFNVGSPAVLDQVVFTGNSTTGSHITSAGGGMGNSGSSSVLRNVDFIDNQAAGSGGGMYNVFGSAPVLTRVNFIGNRAAGNSGGGMANLVDSAPTMINVVFRDNTAELLAGGLWVAGSEATLVNALFIGNQSGGHAGAIDVSEGSATLVNATLGGNSAENNGGGLYVQSGSTLTATNTIVWGNAAGGGGKQILVDDGSAVELVHSLYRNGTGDVLAIAPDSFQARHSLTRDPLFVDAGNGDLRLSEGSPAVNTGDPATDPELFPDDVNGDPVDLDDQPRFVGPAIDMGAFESAFDTPAQAELVFDPAALDFGNVGIGITSPPRTVQLRNVGIASAAGLDFGLTGSAFAVDTSACDDSLAAEAQCQVLVTFTPSAPGAASGELSATGGDVVASLSLAGVGVEQPRITIGQESIAATLVAGEIGNKPLSIANIGTATLDWTAATAQSGGSGDWPARGATIDCTGGPGVIGNDDGTIELGFPSFQNVVIVDRFTPAGYPLSLNAVCVALMAEEMTSIGFEIVVYADNGPGGAPGTLLGALAVSADELPVFTPPPPPGYAPTWLSYDISSLGISVESGGVYIGVRWTQMQPSVYLAADTSPPNPLGHAGGYLFAGGNWMPLAGQLPGYRAMFVRAVGPASGCAAPAAVDWLEATPGAGSIAAGDSSAIDVRFDATGLTPGVYDALLCIASNDPDNPLTTVPVQLTVAAPGPYTVAALSGGGQAAVVGMPFAMPLSVQVRDAAARPLAGVTVRFSSPGAGAGAVLSAGTVLTDGNGHAIVAAVANDEVGSYVVSASVEGVATQASFPLSNTAAMADVAVDISTQREYIRHGQMLDYLVRIDNAGPDAIDGVEASTALASQLDLAFATWLCLGPASSGCTPDGQGNLADGGLLIPAGGSVSYLVSAPVRWDADGVAQTLAQAGHAGDPEPANDSDAASSQIVLYRDGFQAYGDGAGALPFQPASEPLTADGALTLVWPPPGEAVVELMLLAAPSGSTATGAAFRVERLNSGAASWVRMIAVADAGEYASAWLPATRDEAMSLSLTERVLVDESGEQRREQAVVLVAGHGSLQLPLVERSSAYRLWSSTAITVSTVEGMQ